MINQNTKTAKYYDIVYEEFKFPKLLYAEIKLIQTLVQKNGSILDIGCGSGRHLIPLSKLNYNITGIDNSSGMLDLLKSKYKNADIKKINVYKYNLKKKFDLIIMMWNSFNEIVLTKNEAIKLIKKFKLILNKKGKILINIDDPSQFDQQNLNFQTKNIIKNIEYSSDWKQLKYYPKTNLTLSKETVTVKNLQTNKIIFKKSANIKQRWWAKNEINEITSKFGFKLINKRIKYNKEYYLVLSLNDK